MHTLFRNSHELIDLRNDIYSIINAIFSFHWSKDGICFIIAFPTRTIAIMSNTFDMRTVWNF